MLWDYQGKRHTYCRCIGIDGNEYIIRQDALISGVTHSIRGACSGGKPHDITGQKFGRLTAIEPIEDRASNGGIMWKCICDCGNIWYSTMNNLKRGHTKSCGCWKDDYIESTKVDIIGKRFGMLTVIEELPHIKYERRKVKCMCDCGTIRECIVSDLTTGHTNSCGCAFISGGEKYIETILDEFKINYIPQKRFKDCKRIKPLPFDFYLPDKNTCIEYDGRQHEIPIEHFGGEKSFKDRQENDRIKNEYCRKNNITLIRIPYTKNKKEIYEIIKNLVSPATITA